MDKALFRQRLQQLRERQHKSRYVVSELCGLPSDAFRIYERGISLPSVESLVMIADYFDVSIDYLVGRTDNKK